jgi:hypothetical protein
MMATPCGDLPLLFSFPASPNARGAKEQREVVSLPSPSPVRAFPLRVSAPPSNGLAVVPFAPEGVAFFFPVPPMDAHRNREEQAWLCGGATFPASPRLRPVSFLSLCHF